MLRRSRPEVSGNEISLADLRERMRNGFQPILVDVRTPGEFARIHAAGARSMPLGQVDPSRIAADCRSSDGRVYVLCQSGTRAATACRHLAEAGIPEIYAVEGGTQAWQAAGLPVVTGSGAISLERQVRIVAGSFVLLGCILAWLIKPQFILLSAFVGCGLVFAGITDICGMGILLGKLPWNRRS
jgi:rhodanese-related sulfurtransferase